MVEIYLVLLEKNFVNDIASVKHTISGFRDFEISLQKNHSVNYEIQKSQNPRL